MAIKYFIRYFDIKGIEHRLNLYDDTFEDEAIQVDGQITLTYADTDNSLEAIRGQGLSVQLEANQDLTFNDLWSENEKTYKVEYFRDNEIKFNGWLNPEGWFENWVNTDWVITFDCVDGLGYLSDLSFVDENGNPFTGKISYIRLIALALKRTGISQFINTSIDIRYTDLDESKDVLNNVYANANRYIKDDEETYMSCEEVIRDILEPFGACLTSHNGEWYIFKPNQLYSSSTATFFRYNSNGYALDYPFYPPTKTLDLSFTLGSNINDFYPHHCSGNQTIRNVSSIGAYRISYKYGLVKSYLDNTKLCSYDGITIPDWNILSTTNLDPLVANECGVVFNNVSGSGVANLRSDAILIGDDERVNVYMEYNINGIGYIRGSLYFRYQIIICDKPITDATANKYYLQDDLTWGNVGVTNTLEKVLTGTSVTRTSDLPIIDVATPIYPSAIGNQGYLYVVIITPQETPTATHETLLSFVDIKPFLEESQNVEGEFHTFQRTTKPSAKVENTKEVATGDNPSDTYLGTLYKADKVTPTETWNRLGVEEEKPLLQIMGEETLRLNQKTSRVFSGDIYGYFQYFSVIYIDGLDGVFLPIKYSYDTKNNIINADFKQIYGDELEDIDYEKTFDYGETVKPTIRG